jgi:heme-degrading monooxygenase HmoA
MVVSVTRLRLRSLWYLPMFAYHAGRSRRQAERTAGCLRVQTRKTKGLTFWTLTFWDSEQSLKQFMKHRPHRQVMPKLSHWCDEAAVNRWVHNSPEQPTWEYAAAHLAEHGRLSRVTHPSELHESGRIDVT